MVTLVFLGKAVSAAQPKGESEPCSFEYENHNLIDYGSLAVQEVKGTVTDPQQVAVLKTCVGIFTETERKLVVAVESVGDGKFLLPNIPPGRYRLVAKADPLCAANVQLRAVKSAKKETCPAVHIKIWGLDTCSYVDLGRDGDTNPGKSSKAGMPVSAALPNLFPDQNKKLIGTVVLFDSFLSSHGSRADFIVKTEIDDQKKYIRLLYAASGFGFDAPAATPEQLIPQQMFSAPNLIWTFNVHPPSTAGELSACTEKRKQWEPANAGGLKEVERYTGIPGATEPHAPKPESLPCMIVQSWPSEPDRVTRCEIPMHREAQEATLTVVYKFETNAGKPVNITRVRSPFDFLENDGFIGCISQWRLPSLSGEGVAEFSYRTAQGWTETRISGKGFSYRYLPPVPTQ